MNDIEKIEFAMNELHKLKAYFKVKTELIESYINEVKSKLKHKEI